MKNYFIIFKYLNQNKKVIFFQNNFFNKNTINFFCKKNNFYYNIIHFKLSSFFYSLQLLDIFSYCNLSKKTTPNDTISNNSVVVYNFHLLKNNWKFFFFLLINQNNKSNNLQSTNSNLFSISEIFFNSNWLERETSELSNIFFYGKKDIRNLMLMYGDSSSPLKKQYPCVGFKEYFYDSISDSIITSNCSIQF